MKEYRKLYHYQRVYPWISLFFQFNYFWLLWMFVAALGLSLVAARGGYFLVGVLKLLIVVASLVAEHGL